MVKRRPLFESLEDRLCMAAPTLQTTFTLPQGNWSATAYRASPLFSDIFNTGQQELIAVASGAQLVAYQDNSNGTANPIIDYQVPDNMAEIVATPVIVTDPRTGQKDLFAAMDQNQNADGTYGNSLVFGWNLATGKLLPAFANGLSDGFNVQGYTGAYGSLTSGYLNSSGIPDIVVTSYSHLVSAYSIDGQLLWQWNNDDTISSGAVIADIGRDGSPEVIVGGDSSSDAGYPQFQPGGWINVISDTGQLVWRKLLPGEVTWSSPVVADLSGNGTLDIIIGTGDNYSIIDGATATEAGDYIYAFDPNGNMLPGWPYHTTTTGDTTPHEVLASPAVADISGNGTLDVVALDSAGYIHVVQPNGTDLPGFAGGVNIHPGIAQADLERNYGSPTVADVTGQGLPDIIAGSGPLLVAVNPSGQLINIGTTPVGTDGLNEGIDVAPIVGNFDGSGGLTIALTTFDALNPTSPGEPDKVQIYRLPTSTLAPPWPMLRRTASGDAVARSSVYDQKYVAQAFNVLLGSQPSAGTLQTYDSLLNSDTDDLLKTAEYIAVSAPVVDAQITKIYESYLGHAPDANALSYWSTFLSTNTYRQMEELVAGSTEFAQRAGGNPSQAITQLYVAALDRAPSQGEINGWLATKQSIGNIATAILNAPETLNDQFSAIIQAMFGPGTQGLIPPDAEAAYSFEIHAGESETFILSNILTSEANYAATTFIAGDIQNLYRDILGRMASPAEDAGWISAVDTGGVAFSSVPGLILNSTEAREDFVQSQFQTILGLSASPSTLASLANYTSRANIDILLVSSSTFFAEAGGTDAGFVNAAFQSLAGIGISTAQNQSFVGMLQSGQLTTTSLAQEIVYGGSLYFDNLTVAELFVYIPNELQGVLTTGLLPTGDPGQPINPDPSLVHYVLGLYESGMSDTQVLSVILTSPQYYNQSAYYRGLFRARAVRN